MYKKVILTILAAALALSCNRPFKEDYPELTLSSTEYKLSADGGSFEFMVYYSGSWTAALRAEDSSWLLISRDEASGMAYLRVTYDRAVDYARSAFIDIDAGSGGQMTVTLNQAAL